MHIDDEVNARTTKTSAAFGRHVEVIGIEVESTWHKAESLQIRGAAITIIRMQNLDSLPTAWQKTGLLPYKLS